MTDNPTLVLNGTARPHVKMSVKELVRRETGATAGQGTTRAGAACGIAVAINGEVIPRSAWDLTDLLPGDRVELLSAVQGG